MSLSKVTSCVLLPLSGVGGKQGGAGPFSSVGDWEGQGGQGGAGWAGRSGGRSVGKAGQGGAVGGMVGGKHLRLPVLGV